MVLLAHQDDEVAIAPMIVKELAQGSDVFVVYLTDGAAKGVTAERRRGESLRALRSLGVPHDRICFAGTSLSNPDGRLVENLGKTHERLSAQFFSTPVDRLYTLAWEGGHPDHDAAHLLGLALARERQFTEVRQFPIYNAFGCKRFFRVMASLPGWHIVDSVTLDLAAAARFTMLCAAYPSQRRTWLGLSPGVAMRYLLGRTNDVYAAETSAVTARPHKGQLLYERMFGISYYRFNSIAQPFIEHHVLA